jgi:SNF2 family DNA or RNA helicase
MLELSPYQLEARNFFTGRARAMLFDAPGVGKTLPAISAAVEVKRPFLITAPAYLLPNWKREIQRHSPLAVVTVADGTPKQRAEALRAGGDFVLTSYNNWAGKKYPALYEQRWNFIFDEAHRLRGRNSLWTKEVLRLTQAASKNKSSYMWLLTGTPMVRDPGDLYPLLRLMDPRAFKSYWSFVGEWCELKTTPWATEVGQLKEGLEEKFWEMVSKYSLRRSTADIPELQNLSHTYNEILVDLPPSVYKMFADVVKSWVLDHPDLDSPEAIASGGALVQRMRQLTSVPPTKANPKLDALIDLLEDHQEPVIVWCWYRKTAEAVRARLTRPWVGFTGDDPAQQKQNNLKMFETMCANGRNPVIVATISAMKEGVNLQHARTQIFLEESYLPSDNEQAIARSKRRGQTHPVNVYHIHATNSLDMKVHEHQEKREVGISRAMLEYVRKEFL